LQPFTGVSLVVNGSETPYSILEKDNSLALVAFDHPDTSIVVEVQHPDYQPSLLSLVPDTPAFAILNPKLANHVFESVHSTGRQPKSVTFIDNTRVAVPLLADTGIDIIDVVSGHRQRIAPPEPWASRIGFVESLVLPQRSELWVSQMTTASIHVFDLQTLDYKLTIRTDGVWSKVLAYNAALDRVFFTHWVSGDVSIINPYTYKEEQRVKYRAVPRGLSFSDDGQYMYLAQYEQDGRAICQVLKINLNTMAVEHTLGALGAKRHIVQDSDRQLMYVSDMARSTIEVYDQTSDTLLRTIRVFDKPNTIQLSPDRRFLYVSCRGPNNPVLDYLYKGYEMGQLYVIDTLDFSVHQFVEGGNQPTGLDVSPDGRRVVFSDFLDFRLRVYLRLDFVRLYPDYWLAALDYKPVAL